MGSRQTIYVPEASKRFLWPAQDAQAQIAKSTTGKIHGTRVPFASHTQEFQFPMGEIQIPRKTWDFKYVKMKIVFNGNAKLTYPVIKGAKNSEWQVGNDLKVQSSDPSTSAKIEKKLNEEFTAEFSAELSKKKIDKVSDCIAKRDWNGVVKQILSAKLKGKGTELTKHSRLSWELDVSPDENGCFLGATGKLAMAFKLDEVFEDIFKIKAAPGKYPTVEFEVSATFRIGLTEAGWLAIGEKVGLPAIRAAISVVASQAARAALVEAIAVAGVVSVVVVVGVAVPFGSLYLCDQARKDGQQIGVLSRYCRGYLARVAIENNLPEGYSKNAIKNAGAGDINRLGWNDASWAIQTATHPIVQGFVIYHFGSDWSASWFSDPPKNVRSRVGRKLDIIHEIDGTALKMAKQIYSQFDDFIEYAERRNIKGLIGSKKI